MTGHYNHERHNKRLLRDNHVAAARYRRRRPPIVDDDHHGLGPNLAATVAPERGGHCYLPSDAP